MRSWLAIVVLVVGAALVVAAGVTYYQARDAQQREQARLDREWVEVQDKYRRHVPPALPPGRPDPARLEGVPVMIGLAGAGVVLGGAALVFLVVTNLIQRRA